MKIDVKPTIIIFSFDRMNSRQPFGSYPLHVPSAVLPSRLSSAEQFSSGGVPVVKLPVSQLNAHLDYHISVLNQVPAKSLKGLPDPKRQKKRKRDSQSIMASRWGFGPLLSWELFYL